MSDESADRALSALEGQADKWAVDVNLNGIIDNIVAPMKLSSAAPDDVRQDFMKRMKEQTYAIVCQAWIEGGYRMAEGGKAKRDALRTERDQALALLRKIDEAIHSHIDGCDLIEELCPSGWHYCDIIVRINGQDKRYQGDWLKRLWYAMKKYRAAASALDGEVE